MFINMKRVALYQTIQFVFFSVACSVTWNLKDFTTLVRDIPDGSELSAEEDDVSADKNGGPHSTSDASDSKLNNNTFTTPIINKLIYMYCFITKCVCTIKNLIYFIFVSLLYRFFIV